MDGFGIVDVGGRFGNQQRGCLASLPIASRDRPFANTALVVAGAGHQRVIDRAPVVPMRESTTKDLIIVCTLLVNMFDEELDFRRQPFAENGRFSQRRKRWVSAVGHSFISSSTSDMVRDAIAQANGYR